MRMSDAADAHAQERHARGHERAADIDDDLTTDGGGGDEERELVEHSNQKHEIPHGKKAFNYKTHALSTRPIFEPMNRGDSDTPRHGNSLDAAMWYDDTFDGHVSNGFERQSWRFSTERKGAYSQRRNRPESVLADHLEADERAARAGLSAPSGPSATDGVHAVGRTQEQQDESTRAINQRIIDKEMRWSGKERCGDYTEALGCAKGAAEKYEHPHEPEVNWSELYSSGYFVDDVKGGTLNREMVIEARKLEMAFFKKMGVYREMHRSELPAGARTITTKWVDTNKGTESEPNYTSRLVGREIKTDSWPDLFAATPPLESLRYILSLCASSQSGSKPHRLLSVDVKRAYFYAPARRPIFIELPEEDRLPGEENMVAQLNLSLYGTRDAAHNWTKEYTRFLLAAGFTAGRASPCNFYYEKRGMALIVHGDDFTISGPEEDLNWLHSLFASTWDVTATLLGPESHHKQDMKVLNRCIRWTAQGIEYEADPRHRQAILKELELESCKPVSTPWGPQEQGCRQDQEGDVL